MRIMSEQFCFIIDKRSLITCTRLFLHVRVFLLAASRILSKCIPYVTGIKLLDTKVLESQLHGTNSCVRLLAVKLRNEKTPQCWRDRKAKEIKTDHYCVSLENRQTMLKRRGYNSERNENIKRPRDRYNQCDNRYEMRAHVTNETNSVVVILMLKLENVNKWSYRI